MEIVPMALAALHGGNLNWPAHSPDLNPYDSCSAVP